MMLKPTPEVAGCRRKKQGWKRFLHIEDCGKTERRKSGIVSPQPRNAPLVLAEGECRKSGSGLRKTSLTPTARTDHPLLQVILISRTHRVEGLAECESRTMQPQSSYTFGRKIALPESLATSKHPLGRGYRRESPQLDCCQSPSTLTATIEQSGSAAYEAPGPGSYNPTCRSKSPAYTIGKSHATRRMQQTPSPADYDPQPVLPSSPCHQIGRSQRGLVARPAFPDSSRAHTRY